jgi:hypothetical protein
MQEDEVMVDGLPSSRAGLARCTLPAETASAISHHVGFVRKFGVRGKLDWYVSAVQCSAAQRSAAQRSAAQRRKLA